MRRVLRPSAALYGTSGRSRRVRLGVAATASLAIVGAALSPAQAGTAPAAVPDDDAAAKPNVVVIMTDDQTYDQANFMPQLQEFYDAKGTSFDNFVVSYSLCCPSRATFLTGQYALHHGVLSNTEPRGGYPAMDHENALPLWLQDAGYRTAMIGKYLNGTPLETIAPGWDDWQATAPHEYYNYDINDNGTIVHYGSDPEDYQADVLAERAAGSITEAAASGDPFFTYIAPHAPHSDSGDPATPAPRHEGMFKDEPLPDSPNFNEADLTDKPAYIAAHPPLTSEEIESITEDYRGALETLQSIDDLFATVVEALETTGELDNTIIMFTSDNGRMYGEHRVERGKGVPYEESIRVPLLVAGPGFDEGDHLTAQAANIDLAPTIVAAAGATASVDMDGMDLRDIVDKPGSVKDRAVLIERYEGDCFEGVRTPDYTYVRNYTDEEELYDLDADPYQLTNLAGTASYAVVKADLSAQTDEILGDDFWPCSIPPLTVSAGDATVTESRKGKVSVSVPMTLSNQADGPVTVGYTLSPGTATAEDFTVRSGTVTFAEGTIVSSLEATVLADKVKESNETFTVDITSVSPGFATLRGSGTVTIRNAPTGTSAVSIGDVAMVEGDIRVKGTQPTYVTVSITERLDAPLVIDWSTADGTAFAGSDYTAASGQVTIPAGKTSVLIPVQTTGGVSGKVEPDEKFVVNISTTSGLVRIEDPSGSVTLLDVSSHPEWRIIG